MPFSFLPDGVFPTLWPPPAGFPTSADVRIQSKSKIHSWESSVTYDILRRLLPDIILLTQCYFQRGTRLNAMERFCICSLWSHLNVLTFFLTGGCAEGLGAFWFFFNPFRTRVQVLYRFLYRKSRPGTKRVKYWCSFEYEKMRQYAHSQTRTRLSRKKNLSEANPPEHKHYTKN